MGMADGDGNGNGNDSHCYLVIKRGKEGSEDIYSLTYMYIL